MAVKFTVLTFKKINMKKTITTSLLMILMVIINVNVKAQVLNNVFTDKNAFGPVESGNVGMNYAIIKDTLYITGSTSFVKVYETRNMSFPNTVFMYSDLDRYNLYIATKDSGFYMYNTQDLIVRRSKIFKNINSYIIKKDVTNSLNDRLFTSSNDRICNFNLNTTVTNTLSVVPINVKMITGVRCVEYDNVNSNLVYSTGITVCNENDALNTLLSSTSYTYNVNDMEFFNGNLYHATNQGVYNSNTSTLISDGSNYDIIKTYNSNLYFAKSTGEMFKCNATSTVSQMTYSNTVNVVSKVNSISYVRSNDGTTINNYYLFVSTDKGLFIDFANVSDTTVFPVNRSMFNNLPISYTNTVSATGIEESVLANTSGLYPVPNNGSFSYNTKFAGTLQVLNISGQVVFEQKIEEGVTKIDLNLDNGIYVSQFNCVQGAVRKKFVVNN